MKKTYIHPKTDIVEIKQRLALLNTSTPPLSGDYEEGDEIL